MTAYPPFPARRQSPLPTVIAGAAFVIAAWLLFERAGFLTPSPKAEPRAVTPRAELAGMESTFVEVFEKCSPSVASINTSALTETWQGIQEQRGAGSGFVWDNAGIVVTNHHVVEGAQQVLVTVAGRNFRADVLATSPDHDLAVVRLRGNVSGLVPLPIGRSAELRVGQTAIAIGNPFGFNQTMTTGIVSALDRSVEAREGTVLRGLIQVDAAINRGNSGGPLLDSAGRLIGVTTAIYSPSGTSAGIGFAVPVDLVNEVVPRLIGGLSKQAVLGVKTDFPSMRLDGELGYTAGAIVTDVIDGYGAAAAGLRPFVVGRDARGRGVVREYGDVIVALDDQPVRSYDELPRVLNKRTPGETVKLTVVRGLPDAPQKVDLAVQLTAANQRTPTGM
jgi:S1-C subfamily serine protease